MEAPPSPLGPEPRKIHPKLRMIANGSAEVNALRAEHCSCVAVTRRDLVGVPSMRGVDARPVAKQQFPGSVQPSTLVALSPDVRVSVFIELNEGVVQRRAFPGETARRGSLATAAVRLTQVPGIAGREEVAYLELGQPLAAPTPIVAASSVGSPAPSLRHFGSAAQHGDGEGVLIGIIDVQGFDFAHPDFLDAQGNTRWVRIWDQGGDVRPAPKGFGYGAEFTAEHLNRAIREAPGRHVPPQALEPQSQVVEGSHGTHVASIAAGNLGVCRGALLAGVLISIPEDDLERRKSFYDSTRIAHAVDYLVDLAEELQVPVSINISLGTNGHAHDASAGVNRWIDNVLAVAGRSICVAAGNAGQHEAAFPGDTGYVMGRIHTSGRLAARGLTTDIEWIVVGNGIADVSENELEIWYSPQDRFAVEVRPPNDSWIGPVEPGQFIENQQLEDGSFLSVYNELYHPANGCNFISLYLSPLLSREAIVGVRAGQWMVRLHGLEVRDGHYHGWVERDDPRRLGRLGPREAWGFPSFFSERSNVDNASVSSLACGHRIICVANLEEGRERIHITSSQGPTRDGRSKPDAAAPGTDIAAAKGFAGPDDLWISLTGTSMASPFVAGVIGLMLAVNRRLTAGQILGIIQRTARPLPGADFSWSTEAGFGRIDPDACIAEAARVEVRQDVTR